jgi:hypothetical protein
VALAQGRLVLRVPGEGLRVLDAVTGSELRRLPLATAGSQGSIELVGSTVYVFEGDKTPNSSRRSPPSPLARIPRG